MTQEAKTEEVVVETPPVVEDINIIKGELEKLKTELEQKDKGFKSLQQSLTQKDRELKAQSDLTGRLVSIEQRLTEQKEIQELEIAARTLGRDGDEEELAKVTSLLKAKVAEQENNRKQADIKRQQERDALAAQEYNQKADVIYTQAQTLFEGDDLKDIEDLLKSGNLIVAQREVRNASKGKTPVAKVESLRETDEELRERIFKEEMEKRHPGMYASDTGSPGGVSSSEAKIRTDYVANPDNSVIRDRYLQLRREKGF